MILADQLLALTDGQSGVTFATKKTLEGRILALTTGKSGLLAFEIAGDTLTVLTDNLAKQYAIYRDNIDNIDDPDAPDAKDAFEANITLLEALIGFEPVEELLDAAIAERDHVCIPGQDPARSGLALIDTYRYIVNEFNLFFDRNILQAALDQGVQLAPEFLDLMDAVFPVHIKADTDGAVSGNRSVFGPDSILASAVLLAPGGPNTFIKAREKLPEDVDDDLFLVSSTGNSGIAVVMRITVKQVDGTIAVIDVAHPNTPNISVAIDSPNKYVSVELMKALSGGVAVDSFLVVRERVRELPGS